MSHQALGPAEALFPPDTLLFSSADPRQAARDVARIFKPHTLRVRGSDLKLHAKMNTIRSGNFSASRLEYGADVEIDPGPLDDFFLIQIPVSGNAEIGCGNARFESSVQIASLLSPTLPVRMRWLPGNAQLCVRFERAFVEQHCASHLGHTVDGALEFDPAVGMDAGAGRYFLRLLRAYLDELAVAADTGVTIHPLMRDRVGDQFAASLLNALLYGQPHTWSDELRRPEQAVAPHCVRKAEEYLRDHYREPVSMETLALAVGVSTRTLFAGFRDFRKTTPMAYLRDLRLDKARGSLLAGEASSTAQVTNIALDSGFSHLGRFAASYRARFGESPSTTARFKRRSH